jgi:hypothetical protein
MVLASISLGTVWAIRVDRKEHNEVCRFVLEFVAT